MIHVSATSTRFALFSRTCTSLAMEVVLRPSLLRLMLSFSSGLASSTIGYFRFLFSRHGPDWNSYSRTEVNHRFDQTRRMAEFLPGRTCLCDLTSSILGGSDERAPVTEPPDATPANFISGTRAMLMSSPRALSRRI